MESPSQERTAEPLVFVACYIRAADPARLRARLESIRAQSWSRWRCLVCDDGGNEASLPWLESLTDADPRFSYRANPGRLGPWHGLEEALFHCPAEAQFVCHAGENEVWRPDRLATLVAAFAEADIALVRCGRIGAATGREQRASAYAQDRPDGAGCSPARLLLGNAAAGGVMFRRAVLDVALPFPLQGPRPDLRHDLWLALAAAALGRVVSTSEPPTDRDGQDAGAGARDVRLIGSLRRSHLARLREVPSAILPAERRRAAEAALAWHALLREGARLAAAGSVRDGLVLGRLALAGAARPLRRVAVRGVRAVRALRQLWRSGRHRLRQEAGRALRATAASFDDPRLRPLATRTAELSPALNVLVPGLSPGRIYGGIATAVDLALAVAGKGVPVRFLVTDWGVAAGERAQIERMLAEAHAEGAALAARIPVIDAARGRPFEVGRRDRFLATAWWTAMRLCRTPSWKEDGRPFFYLVQDFEPAFHPWSSEYALALASYRLPAAFIFNTELLHAYFAEQGLVDRPPLAVLKPPIDPARFFPPSAARLAARAAGPRRVLVYGRPGVPRNLFETAMTGLDRWIETYGIAPAAVRIASAGEEHAPVRCARGIVVESLGRVARHLYPDLLRQCDLGLSLMLSPHPSYPPLEMAMAGVVCVTNRFGPKDLSRLTRNIVSCEPDPDSVAAALDRAWRAAGDIETRLAESRFALAMGEDMAAVAARLAAEVAGGVEAGDA